MRLLTAILAIPSIVLFSACSSYEAKHLSLQDDLRNWKQVSKQLDPQAKAHSRQSIQFIGLLLNPELNRFRIEHARSSSIAQYAGLWQDPSLEIGLERNLAESINNSGIGLGLTLPITGLPGLSKQIAEMYNEANYWKTREQERLYLLEVDRLCNKILISEQKLSLSSARVHQLSDENKRIEKLHQLGEVDYSAYQISAQRMTDLLIEQQAIKRIALDEQIELRKQLGLYPSSKAIRIKGSAPAQAAKSAPRVSTTELLNNPGLKAIMASYAATEKELQRAIRQQYPELNISPSFKRDDGEKFIEFGIGLSIPLWNRNREAIATSKGDRELAEHDAITLWHDLFRQADSLQKQEKLAQTQYRNDQALLRQIREARDKHATLHQLGESSLEQLAESRHQTYQKEIQSLDRLLDILDYQAQIKSLKSRTQQ